MKRNSLILIAIIIVATMFGACQKPQTASKPAATSATTPTPLRGPAGFPPPVMNKPYPGTGVVVSIDRDEGWIEINHEDIKELMPAMQMEFNVKDRALLDKAKVGERVDFVIVETETGEFLTEINPAAGPKS